MIEEGFWKSWIVISFLAGPFLLIYIQIAFNLYLIRRHLDAMMDALPNSRYIYIWRGARTQGWFGGMLLVSKIAGMIMFPKSNIRTGDFDKEDIANFPPHLKRLLKIDTAMLIVSIIWSIATSILLKYR